jgi:hypothetical protein
MGGRSLQIVCAILGVIPIVSGIFGMAGVRDPLYASAGCRRAFCLTAIFVSSAAFGLGLALRSTALFLPSRSKRYCFAHCGA